MSSPSPSTSTTSTKTSTTTKMPTPSKTTTSSKSPLTPKNILITTLILISPLLIWSLLSLLTSSFHPIMVVISESMAPAFHRGDLIFLSNRQESIAVGEIPVFWFRGKPMPMVHRAIKVLGEGVDQLILTKGDNNRYDDVSLYPIGQSYGTRGDVIGVVKGYLPYLGWVTLALGEYSWLKWVAVAVLAVWGLLS